MYITVFTEGIIKHWQLFILINRNIAWRKNAFVLYEKLETFFKSIMHHMISKLKTYNNIIK